MSVSKSVDSCLLGGTSRPTSTKLASVLVGSTKSDSMQEIKSVVNDLMVEKYEYEYEYKDDADLSSPFLILNAGVSFGW
jgi:hypothetical protein